MTTPTTVSDLIPLVQRLEERVKNSPRVHGTVTLNFSDGRKHVLQLAGEHDQKALIDFLAGLSESAQRTFRSMQEEAPKLLLAHANGTAQQVAFHTDADRDLMVQWLDENRAEAAQRVHVVAMPTRETTTSVKRDGDGNITKTTQTESDKGA